ncbi:Ig-like domain-containing protein [Amycolatopsis sp. GM8]|uniref:L,D-transpeptidase n=1 Tax=Amycolatopsis sp. GM8 TaxID=2896530 RepID=UPI001F46B579|nr:Ig-like domain-containing protein [Amycolatopsis sp. GM8]
MDRRTVVRAALVAGTGVVVAACTGGGNDSPVPGGGQQAESGPVAKLTAQPAVDAKDVPVRGPVTVRVADGALADVKLTNADGEAVEGSFNADRTVWTSGETLGYGKTYTYTASATGTDNKPAQLAGSFTTLNPKQQIRVTINPADNAQVGVAMPVSVKFSADVSNKAEIEKALTLDTGQQVEGSWGWLSDRQVDFRPKEYWPANITINAAAKLYGIDLGGGAYARADVTTKFKIGRNQVVKINTPDHVMNVYRGGAKVKSYPCSNGLDSDVNRNTPNGTFIVMTREPAAIFDNARYGYTNVNKKWACRISNHGEYIHENQDNAAAIGHTNNSHGCVNLLAADAKNYFDSALIGDPVEITGSRLGGPVNSDVMDWLVSWSAWRGKSAL